MLATIAQYMPGVEDPGARQSLQVILSALGDRLSSQTLSTPGLAIKTGGSPLAMAATAFRAVANGVLRSVNANTDMAALSGTVTNATFNVYCFYIDSAGTLTTAIGSAGATLAQVKLPNQPIGKAMVGFVIINPTGTGDFVGGTTALDSATVVPNAVYVNTLGAFDPTVLTGQ
jgi:hypothetical protein